MSASLLKFLIQGASVMSEVVKERIAADLQKAKEEGNLRSERIREIVKAAVAEAVSEIKQGSGEIRTIARDAISAVIELLRDKGQETKADVYASIEGVIDGIKASRQQEIAQKQAQVENLQADLDTQTQTLEAEMNSALVEIETTAKESTSASPDLKSLFASAVEAVLESKQFAVLKDQYVKLKSQLAVLDERLAERYGDRYEQVKQQLEKYLVNTKDWYEQTKAEVRTGVPDPVQRMQVEIGAKMAAAGAAVARKEKAAKDRLQELLHKETQTEVSDAD
jgi:DNA repair exonuclease SbcCD ATPase subunit